MVSAIFFGSEALERFTSEGGTAERLMREDFHHLLMKLCQKDEASSANTSVEIEWANDMERETARVLEKGMLDAGHPETFVSWAHLGRFFGVMKASVQDDGQGHLLMRLRYL